MFAAGFMLQPLGSIAIAGDNDLNEPTAQEPAIYSAARKMAMLHVGGEKLSPQIKKVMYDQTLESYNELPDFQALQAEFPGVTVAVVDAVVPVAVRQTENSMPAYIDRLADLYSRNMTMDEFSQMTQWFQSPTFGRLQNSMESNFDLRPIMGATAEDENYQMIRAGSEPNDCRQRDKVGSQVKQGSTKLKSRHFQKRTVSKNFDPFVHRQSKLKQNGPTSHGQQKMPSWKRPFSMLLKNI